MNKQLIKGYLKECKSGKDALLKTFFSCSEDEKNLYFNFSSQEIFSCPMHKEYNKPLYEGDTVEVFLTLDRPKRYLEIEINQYNAAYCVIIDNKDGEGDIIISKIAKCVFESVNTFEKDVWECDIKIAKKKLYELGWSEENALINACRQDFDKDKNLNIYSLFPTYSKTFHKVRAFQKLYEGGK